MSMSERSFEESPIIMARVVAERGCSIRGGFAARAAPPWLRQGAPGRPDALSSSVPGSKTISIEDRPGTDLELRMSTKGTLLRRSASSGTVTISATSAPTARALRSGPRRQQDRIRIDIDCHFAELADAENRTTAATARTSNRYLRLQSTIPPITDHGFDNRLPPEHNFDSLLTRSYDEGNSAVENNALWQVKFGWGKRKLWQW